MAQFKADVDILTTADSGRRDLNALIWSVLHTTENSDNTPRITSLSGNRTLTTKVRITFYSVRTDGLLGLTMMITPRGLPVCPVIG